MATPHVKAFHYHRGRKVDLHKLIHRRHLAYQRHGALAFTFPKADDAVYYAPETLGCGDQGQCGSCYLCSSFKVCSKALVGAGKLPADDSKGMLAWQFGMDCHSDLGGCNGGDEAEVIDLLKNTGSPVTSDYGAYTAGSGHCKTGTWTIYKINDYGYCDPSSAANGVGATQLIKNSIKAKGTVSVAAAAGGDWDSLSDGQVISGNSSDINHAISLVGWDDSKGAWAMENQWGTSWGYEINGKPGRAWIKYGADGIGTEAIWVDAGQSPGPGPGPTPTPVPPWYAGPGIVLDTLRPYHQPERISIVVNIDLRNCGGCK